MPSPPDPDHSGDLKRYAAFISYNQRDRAQSRWLHRALETYRFPAKLIGRGTKVGTLGNRLPPIFQDRAELSASANLAASVQVALAQSAFLIVICSPNGARSRWVNEEIREFIRLGRQSEIQCLVIAGEPRPLRNADDPSDDGAFPPALFESGGQEPLAADIRPGMDGKNLARLKLISGITGLAFDELRQREQSRRTRQLVIATSILALALLLVASLAVFALVSRGEAIAQRDIARQKTVTAERTVEFVKSMFAVADPSQAQGEVITARQIVDLGAQRIDRELANEPTVKAELQVTLGEVYTNLGLFKQGDLLLRRSLTDAAADPGLRARQKLALAEALSWQADDEAAARAYREALALTRSRDFDRNYLVPRILAGLGETEGFLGNVKRAEDLIQRALKIDRARNQGEGPEVARDYEALGQVYLGANRYADARAYYDKALAIRLARQGPLHPRTIQDLNQLGAVAYLANDTGAAERYWSRQLPLAEKVLGKDHPEVAVTLNNIARIRVERARYRQAIPLLRRAMAIQSAQRSEGNEELVFPTYNLALALRATGGLSEATQLLKQALRIAEKQKHRNLAPIQVELADIYCKGGNPVEALALLQKARPLMAENYPDQPWRSALLDFTAASCRGDVAAMASKRKVVLTRWPLPSYFGQQVSRR